MRGGRTSSSSSSKRACGARRPAAGASGLSCRHEAEAMPVRPQAATASGAPGTGSPDTCRTPVDVEENCRHDGSESIRVTRSVARPPRRDRAATSRSSGPGGQHAQKSETRWRRSSTWKPRARWTPRRSDAAREGRPGAARDRPGRAQPAAKQGARDGATRLPRCGRHSGRAPASADEAVRRAARAARREKRAAT